MKHAFLRFFALVGIAAALFSLTATTASARVFIGGGVVTGSPYYAYPPYYAYYPPPPPVYYAPPPAYPYGYYEPPPPAPADRYYTSQDNGYCREYTRTVTVDGQKQKAYGHACRQPDGTWRIID